MNEVQRTSIPLENKDALFASQRTASFLGFDLRPDRPYPEPVMATLDALSPPEPAKRPRVATFFALYPEPLGLLDGTTFSIALNAPVTGFARTAMHVKENDTPYWLDPEMTNMLVVSIRFHHGRLKWHVIEERDEQLFSVVRSVEGTSFPGFAEYKNGLSDKEELNTNSEDLNGKIYTVVEMSTQLVMPAQSGWAACEPAEIVMGPTLTRCINGLMEVIAAYRFGEKALIANPARERLGPAIVAATRAADPAQGSWDAPARYVINSFATHGGNGFVRGGHSPQTMQKMSSYLKLARDRHPILPIGSMQQDLQHAMYIEGNFRAVIIFAHSATEILMDLALMALLFEENANPKDAVMKFARPLKTRLLSDYHDRLGGAWGSQGSHPVAIWIRDVLTIRHQVVHTGYMPFYEQAQAAHDAHFGVGTYLRDRLACQVKRYPFTTGLLLTANGFERRRIQTKASDAAIRAGSERLQEFLQWRDELIRQRG